MFGSKASMKTMKLVLFGAAALLALGLGGCNNEEKAESEALRNQLTQTQTERDNNQKLLEQSEAQKAELRTQLDTMSRTRAESPMQPPIMDGGRFGDSRPQSREETMIEIAGDVLFSPGQATVSAAGRRELDKVASTLKSRYPRNQIRVEGYTDSDPVRKSSFGSNDALSKARAVAVEKYLASKGVSDSRITAVGRGSSNPKGSKAASRRVEIHVLSN